GGWTRGSVRSGIMPDRRIRVDREGGQIGCVAALLGGLDLASLLVKEGRISVTWSRLGAGRCPARWSGFARPWGKIEPEELVSERRGELAYLLRETADRLAGPASGSNARFPLLLVHYALSF